MTAISIYKNVKDSTSTETITVDDFIASVKGGRWMEPVQRIRDTQDSSLKLTIPLVTISGHFSARNRDSLIRHSGFICIDIDNVPTEELTDLANKLWADRYSYSVFKSVRGNGMAVIVRIDPARHEDAFEGLQRYYADTYGVIIDRSCRDITRARFVSYDPATWHNPKSAKFAGYIAKKDQPKSLPSPVFSSRDLASIFDQITSNSINITGDCYNDWFRIGFALADEFGENPGREYFHIVSAQSPKYNQKVCDRQYTACLKSRGYGISIGTFFHHCKLAGVAITSPETTKAKKVANQAMKQGRSKESAIRILTEIEQMEPGEATELVERTYANPSGSKEPTGNPVETIELFLSTNYSLRYNIITQRIENNGEPFPDRSLNSAFLSLKRIEAKISQDLFNTYVRSDLITPFHPIREYLEKNATHPTHEDCFIRLADTIRGDNEHPDWPSFLPDLLTKFYLGLIAGALGEAIPPLVPVLWGPGGVGQGKTTFWAELLPAELLQYFTISDLTSGKDDDILLSQKWLVCDDEWGGKMGSDSKFMKMKAGQNNFTLRRAYGREHEDIKRLSMLCGTSNDQDIISDNANRRIVPIHCADVDLERYRAINKTELLIHAYHLYTSAGEVGFLTREQNTLLNSISFNNTTVDHQAELITTYYLPCSKTDGAAIPMTASEIASYIQDHTKLRINPVQIGKTLSRLEYEQDIIRTGASKTSRRVYWVIPVKAEK